jgi:hypothetical protein
MSISPSLTPQQLAVHSQRERRGGGHQAAAQGRTGGRHGSNTGAVRRARRWSSGAPAGEASAPIQRGSGAVAASLHRFMELQACEVFTMRHGAEASRAPAGEAPAPIRRGSGTVAAGLHWFVELRHARSSPCGTERRHQSGHWPLPLEASSSCREPSLSLKLHCRQSYRGRGTKRRGVGKGI